MQQTLSITEARERGLKRYFTGKKCKNGHVSERYASNGECWQCRQEWRKKNRKKTNKTQNTKREHIRLAPVRAAKRREMVSRHRKALKKYNRRHKTKHALYVLAVKKLPITDAPEQGDHAELLVRCYYCKKHFRPTGREVIYRVAAYTGRSSGECNFYCSDQCKSLCSVFATKSKIFDIKDVEKKRVARVCQKVSKRKLLQKQKQHNCYPFCERCGKEVEVLHLHHTIQVAKNPTLAIKQDGHMILCEHCHVLTHRTC